MLAALLWEKGGRFRIAAFLCTALAITSYEAAIVLPFAIVFAERWVRGRFNRRTVAAMGALFLAYVPAAILIRRGLTAPDTGPMRPLDEIWRSARLDAEAYVLKTFGLFDPNEPAPVRTTRRRVDTR